MNPGPLDIASIGSLIADARRRADWVSLVGTLHDAAKPGGALDGWAFHGTTLASARSAMRRGLSPSHAVVNSPDAPDAWFETKATHWGTPAVAAFFAEDRIESTGRPTTRLAILAARIDDIAANGDLRPDGQMLDCPLLSRLELGEAELLAHWDASDKGWRASWRDFGTVVAHGPGVDPADMTMLATPGDVERLLADLSFGPTPR